LFFEAVFTDARLPYQSFFVPMSFAGNDNYIKNEPILEVKTVIDADDIFKFNSRNSFVCGLFKSLYFCRKRHSFQKAQAKGILSVLEWV